MHFCGAAIVLFCALASTASADEKPRVEAEFPLDVREGFIWIKAAAKESPAPLNFILDSGAAVSTLNADTASRLGLRGGQRVTVKGVGSTAAGLWPQRLNAHFGSVALPKSYLVVDLCNLQASCQCRIDGLIGADFFDGRIVQIDFAAKKLRLLRSSAAVVGETVELRKRRSVWHVPLSINGSAREWFRLDTGCSTDLQWVLTGRAPETSSTRLSIALSEMSLPVTDTSVKLGAILFPNVPASVHRSTIFSGEAGLAGLGLLSRFSVVTLDGKGNRLILTPATAD